LFSPIKTAYATLIRMTFKRKPLPLFGLLALIGIAVFFYVGSENGPSDTLRSVVQTIQKYHFAPQSIDDDYSKRIYSLYLKRIDPGKRFLLQEDIDQLKRFETRLDDDMKSGNLEFVSLASQLLKQRVNESKAVYKELIKQSQDLSIDESFETDWDQRKFASNKTEWKDDWRKFIKYQILTTYISDAESGTSNEAKAALQTPNPEFEKAARTKVEKNMDSYFDRLMKETDNERIDAFIDCVANANDPHTSYLAPQQKDDFDINIKGSLEGIGAVLQEADGYIKVTRIVPGGPAWRQKELKAQDAIIKVAQGDGEPVDIVGARVQDAVRLIRGSKGTKVTLTVKKPEGKIVLIPIIRDVVVLEESYAKSALINGPKNQKIGYIILPSFYRDFSNSKAHNASDDLRNELIRLKKAGATSVILDLRNNGGGALDDAVKVAGLFINYGPVVQVRDRNNKGYAYEDQDPSITFDGELVVLVNAFSASAAEIVSAALQDYGRAIVIGGAHTYGKGTVQTVLNLDSLWPTAARGIPLGTGSVKVTNQKYFRITGGSTQFKGVEPDIVLPDVNDYLDIGEQSQGYPLSWSTTSSAPINKWNNQILPDSIKQKSIARTKADANFIAIADLVKKLKARRKNSTYPLSLTKAVESQKESKQESAALDQIKVQNSSLEAVIPDTAWFEHLEPERASEYKEWLKHLPKDIYINEAAAVLSDLAGIGQ